MENNIIIRESPFQYKRELATVEAFVKSGSGPIIGEVVDLEQKDIELIYKWYSPPEK